MTDYEYLEHDLAIAGRNHTISVTEQGLEIADWGRMRGRRIARPCVFTFSPAGDFVGVSRPVKALYIFLLLWLFA